MRQYEIKYIEKIVPNAYHGTTLSNAKKILKTGTFKKSKRKHNFLGDGVYFYETSRKHAEIWARRRARGNKKIGIFRATINLGKCLDLHDLHYRKLLKLVRQKLKERNIEEITDALVINFYATNIEKFDTVRATYVQPGYRKIYPESAFFDYVQLIICVRNLKRILDFELIYQGE